MEAYVSEHDLRQARIRQLLEHCEQSILDSIIGPFGLHHAMFEDRDGGNLPTVHNAKNGVFPDEEHRDNFAGYKPDKYDRDSYDSKEIRGPLWRELHRRLDSGEVVIDPYSGRPLEKGKIHMDHAISAREHSKDAWLHLEFSEAERKQMINDPSNLNPTSAKINLKKGDKAIRDHLARKQEVHPDVDPKRMKERDDVARRHLFLAKAERIAAEVTLSAGEDAVKLGVRQAVGVVLRTLTQATFLEAKDVYYNGLAPKSDDLKRALTDRGSRIVKATVDSAKNAGDSSMEGALGGLLSELVTWLINQAVTTAKNIVRIIREGILKFIEAIKLILTRPAEMSLDEAIRQATKIIGGILGLAIGIAAEESLKAFLLTVPFVSALSAEIAAVLAGILSGIVMGVVVYLIDLLFDKMSMPFETRSLDLLAKNLSMQQQLIDDVAAINVTYAGIFEKLSKLEIKYELVEAAGKNTKRNFEQTIEQATKTIGLLTDPK